MKMMSEKSSTGDDDCARGRGGAVRKAMIARLGAHEQSLVHVRHFFFSEAASAAENVEQRGQARFRAVPRALRAVVRQASWRVVDVLRAMNEARALRSQRRRESASP